MTATQTFRIPHNCVGQFWTEAIAVLNVASAELRLEAAKDARSEAPGNQWGGPDGHSPHERFSALQRRAERLDQLADWLREHPGLPGEGE